MAVFKSQKSYYDFVSSVNQWRYIRNTEQEEFLATVYETSESRKEELQENRILWRAQVGHDWHDYEQGGERGSVEWPFDCDRMKPLKNKASEGRANPRGIPYLYTATEKDTAISEVRPWVGAYVSVAQLKVLKSLVLINCILEKGPLKLSQGGPKEPNAEGRERAVWQAINEAFSRPVTQSEHIAEYVPTQILAEMFKHNKVDGLIYKSSLGEGNNLVLFNLDVAEVINCTLFQVTSVKFRAVQTFQTTFCK